MLGWTGGHVFGGACDVSLPHRFTCAHDYVANGASCVQGYANAGKRRALPEIAPKSVNTNASLLKVIRFDQKPIPTVRPTPCKTPY